MNRYLSQIIILILIFFDLDLIAQDSMNYDPIINIDVKVVDENQKPLKKMKVFLFTDGKKDVYRTDEKGGLHVKGLSYNRVYLFEFKKRNYAKKTIEIDAKSNYLEEDVDVELTAPINMVMIKKIKKVDYSLIEETPVVRYFIDPNTGFFDLDRTYSNDRKKKIEIFMKTLQDE